MKWLATAGALGLALAAGGVGWSCPAQTPAGSNLAKPRIGGIAIASEFGEWQAAGQGPVGPPGGTVTVTPVTFTLPDATAWVPFTVGAPVAITGDSSPETVTVTGVACATGGSTCAFSANFAFSHAGSFTVSSATGGLQEAIDYEEQLGGGVVVADPAFIGNVSTLASSLKLPANVLLVDETGGNFNFYGLGNGSAPSLFARFSSASGTNLGGGGGSGTVTSVGLSLPSIFNVDGSPVTISGTLAGTLANQNANLIWAGPASGGPGAPAFRLMVGADLPVPSPSTLGGIEAAAAAAHEWISSISAAGVPGLSQPGFTDLLGTVADGQLANAYSGVGGCASHQWANALTRNAAPTCVQPGFSDLSGTAASSQLPAASASVEGVIQLAGDLGASATAPSVVGLHFGSSDIPLGTAPASGQCVYFNGTNLTGTTCGSGPGGGVTSFQVDSWTALTGAVQIASGSGMNTTQSGQVATLNVNQANGTVPGIVTLDGDLGGAFNSPLVFAAHVSVANNSTGTTAGCLAKITSTGAQAVATTDTTGAIGIVTAGAGASGSATIAVAGIINLQFDATATTEGDWVQISSTTSCNGHDAGSSKPASGEIIGHVMASGAASSVEPVLVQIVW